MPSWSDLAFSTFQHRLASFTLPKIPIFVLARPVSAFSGRQLRSFPVSTRKIPAMRCICTHHSLHCTDTALHPRPTYTSFVRIILHHFASTLPGAVSSIAHHTTLLLCYYRPVTGSENTFLHLRAYLAEISLRHISSTKLFASPW
jgi:hypothetical protein